MIEEITVGFNAPADLRPAHRADARSRYLVGRDTVTFETVTVKAGSLLARR
jgi:hypothetical protein